MSRVEPRERPTPAPREAEQGRRQFVDRTPEKAEGDQRAVDTALKEQEREQNGA